LGNYCFSNHIFELRCHIIDTRFNLSIQSLSKKRIGLWQFLKHRKHRHCSGSIVTNSTDHYLDCRQCYYQLDCTL